MDLNFLKTVANDGSLSRASFLLLFYMNITKKFVGSQSILGDILGLDRKTINASIGILESGKYIKRFPLKKDKRLKVIEFIA
ncbi:MAG: hypothetical protein ACD_19C00140G0002 [uncultured bacterium]|nr:MAG: hypothetical protein ACD_19C00140G0002 [uncultured bacterium]